MPTIVAWSFTYVAVRLITGNGGSVPVATNTILATLLSISIIEVIIALPIFRYRREQSKFAVTGVRPKRIDPFYALRVLVLAKSTAIAGALFLGAANALVLMQLSAPVVPEAIWLNFVALVESVILIVTALLIERACKIKDDQNSSEANTSSAKPEATA